VQGLYRQYIVSNSQDVHRVYEPQGKVDCVQDDAAALAPTLFVGVPRVWERVREGVAKKLAARTPIAR
jgi:long-subunit acyl-CoA synthetase (AMP-forming)